jgi:hypothetical protein
VAGQVTYRSNKDDTARRMMQQSTIVEKKIKENTFFHNVDRAP